MSPIEEQLPSELERRLQGLLEESVAHVDGRIRSRLNQARQAAVTEATRRRPLVLRPFVLMPAAGALAAAVLVAFVLWPHSPQAELPVSAEAGHTMEDLDLIADGDGLDLVSAEESDGSFFEWAADQTESGETST
ncbi:MAG TPA: hypothetical protein VGL55_15230 [Steroidobacteraceae bacterium]|jgi:hypothetical protein